MSVASYLAFVGRQGPGFHEAGLYVRRDQIPRLLFQTATMAVRSLPDVQIIGAQKAGTTTIHDLLLQHPDVRAGLAKESHFFDGRSIFGPPRAWGSRWMYRAFFPAVWRRWTHRLHTGRPMRIVDATPVTMMLPRAARLLRAMTPNARLVAVLRDPVDRAWSQYRMNVAWGRETLPFADALDAEEALWASGAGDTEVHWNRSYVRRGLYAEQLRRFRDAGFSADQLLLVAFDDLIRAPEAVANRLYRFVGLPAQGERVAVPVKNRGPVRPLDPQIAARLRARFRVPNRALVDELSFPAARRWQAE